MWSQVPLYGSSTGVQQPTNRESVVQAYATVRMPSQNEAQMITQQIEASLPERAKVQGVVQLSRCATLHHVLVSLALATRVVKSACPTRSKTYKGLFLCSAITDDPAIAC